MCKMVSLHLPLAGIVESQTGNTTDEELGTFKEKLGQLGNQTFNVSIKDDSKMFLFSLLVVVFV